MQYTHRSPLPAAPSSDWVTPFEAAQARREQGDLPEALRLALLAGAAAPGPEGRLRAAHLAAFCHFRLGQLHALVRLAEAVLPQVGPLDGAREFDELLRWTALSASDIGHHDLAMRCAGELVDRARAGGQVADLALALNAMGACYERMGDPWQAERLMTEALVQARRDGGVQALMTTLNNLAAVATGAYYLLREDVDPADAADALQRAVMYAREAAAMAALAGEPFHRLFIEGNLGEALLHQGQDDEAYPLLQRALEAARQGGHQAQEWRIRCTLAEGALRHGEPQQARELLAGTAGPDLDSVPVATRIRLHHALYRAGRALGLTEEALCHHEAGEQLQRRRTAQQLRAQSRLLVTRTEAELNRLQAERARLEAQIERARAAELAIRASQDALTGLGNRRYLDEQLPPLLRQAEQQQGELALVLLDIDHFKLINDRFGHRVGDTVLVELAQLLRENTRAADLLARIGGEEFLIALPDTELPRAIEVCERLRERVEQTPWQRHHAGLAVTVSLGLAMAPPYDAAALFDQADRALYRAKQAGRNRVRAG